MQSSTAMTGFFGKLPEYGDFIHRNLPNAVIAAWDEWLKSYVGATQERLGEGWLDVYLTSPIWRFSLSAGVLDEQAWAGIMLPSVDRVGRYFPFTILRAVDGNTSPSAFICQQASWYSEIEAVALGALDGDMDADQLADAIGQIELAQVDEYLAQTAPDVQAGLVVDMAYDTPNCQQAAPHMLDAFVQSCFPSHSFWSTNGSDRVEPCMFVVSGLPPVSGGAAMMDGLWEDWEWSVPWRLMGEQ